MPNYRRRLFALLLSATVFSLVTLTRPEQTPLTTPTVIASPDTLRAVTTDPKTNVIVLKVIAF